MIATRYDNNTCKLMSITDIYGLQQLITEPTRTTPSSATLIDIYTNCPDKVVCSGVRHISINDHSIVFCLSKIIREWNVWWAECYNLQKLSKI